MANVNLTRVPMTDDQIIVLFMEQLPRLLKTRPAMRRNLRHIMVEFLAEEGLLERFERKIAALRTEMQASFAQVEQRFEQVEQRFEQVDQRFDKLENKMDARFDNLTRQIDRLGSRWGIRNESLFRETMVALLEESFGVSVERRLIGNDEFDIVISNGEHILVEIAASVKRGITERLERKRQLYINEVGVTPARFILAVASIHSRRAQRLRSSGFEVIEPED